MISPVTCHLSLEEASIQVHDGRTMTQITEDLLLPSPPPESLDAHDTSTSRSQLRACENCRRRKVRCPGPADGSKAGACIKCQRFNRQCLYRSRAPAKRQKRVEVRVRELEERIEDLTARLPSSASSTRDHSEDVSRPLKPYVDHATSPTKGIDTPGITGQLALAGLRTVSNALLKRTQLWRKPSERSKAGCSVCKGRKLKCDESRPFCNRCLKDGRDCNYESTTILHTGSSRSDRNREATHHLRFEHFISALDTLGPMLGIDASRTDRRVFHMLNHWEHHTTTSFGPRHTQLVMRNWSFDLASKTPFLLHAICATGALHLRYLQGDHDDDLITLYNYHFELGLELYTQKLSNPVAPEDMDAVFAACMLFALMAYQTSSSRPEDMQSSTLLSPVLDSRPDELTWLTVQCGFLTIKSSQSVQPHLSNSIWHELFHESDSQGNDLHHAALELSAIPPEWRELCQITEHSTADNNPYYQALKLHLMTRDIDATKPENFVHFICFPGRMRPEFSVMVHARDPIALLILSQWLAKMCDMSGWWSEARVTSECYAICAYLDLELGDNPSVATLLQTPMRACGYVAGTSWEDSASRRLLISKIPSLPQEVPVLG